VIERSKSLERRLELECVRYAGSQAVLVFYKGTKPLTCELQADGERIEITAANESVVRALYRGTLPDKLPTGADYWRLSDANGNVVMQGNSDG
jgi:hypothetical protein